MSGSFSDLPKYPGDDEDERAKLLETLRPAESAEPDSARERLRHLFPKILLGAALAFGGFIALGMAILVATRAVDAGLASGLTLVAAFLALPVVAVGAAVYQRQRNRQGRGWS